MEKGANTSAFRQENRRRLTQLLYHSSGLTKQSISTQLELSLPTVNLLISQLQDEDLLYKRSAATSSGGRIPELFYYKYDARFVVGIEVSKNKLDILIIDLAGNMVAHQSVNAAFNDTYTYWRGVRARFLDLLEKNDILLERVIGVGVALPAYIGQKGKKITFYPEMQLPPSSMDKYQDALALPAIVENNANAAGFAEIWYDHYITDALYLSVTNVIRGTLICDRKIIHGIHGRCGEFQLMTVFPPNDELSAMLEALKEQPNFMARAMIPHLNEDKYIEALALGLGNLCVGFDLPIIIGGSHCSISERNIKSIAFAITSMIPEALPEIRLARIRNHPSAVGAALMVVKQFLDGN